MVTVFPSFSRLGEMRRRGSRTSSKGPLPIFQSAPVGTITGCYSSRFGVWPIRGQGALARLMHRHRITSSAYRQPEMGASLAHSCPGDFELLPNSPGLSLYPVIMLSATKNHRQACFYRLIEPASLWLFSQPVLGSDHFRPPHAIAPA